jgi:hypothetical protein
MNISNTSARNRALAIVVFVSLTLHLIALVVFGAFKIVESITREDQTFEAPEIVEVPQEQPEYTVNLEQRNQTSAPPRPNPIVVDSPDVSIPALDIDVNIANASNYGRGSGGFGSGALAGMREMTINLTDFGYTDFVEGTLEGTLFDTKYDTRSKELVDMSRVDTSGLNSWLTPRMEEITYDFTDGSWNVSQLERDFLAASNKLYASYFLIPRSSAQKAPEAFNAADEIKAVSILAYYSGSFTPRESGRFRFVGKADDAIIIRANNRIVFDGSLSNDYSEFDQREYEEWPGEVAGLRNINTGEWMSWKEGRAVDLEVVLAEAPGGRFYALVFIQKQGEDRLRVFSTKTLTEEEKNQIRSIHPDIASML